MSLRLMINTHRTMYKLEYVDIDTCEMGREYRLVLEKMSLQMREQRKGICRYFSNFLYIF